MTGPVGPDRDGIGYLLNQAARASRQLLAEELRHHGLNDIDFILLQNVTVADPAGEEVRLASVAARNNVAFEDLRSSADRLARDGWLVADGAPEDPAYRPSEKALRAIPVFRDSAHWMMERGLNGFSNDEITQLSALLKRLLGNLRG